MVGGLPNPECGWVGVGPTPPPPGLKTQPARGPLGGEVPERRVHGVLARPPGRRRLRRPPGHPLPPRVRPTPRELPTAPPQRYLNPQICTVIPTQADPDGLWPTVCHTHVYIRFFPPNVCFFCRLFTCLATNSTVVLMVSSLGWGVCRHTEIHFYTDDTKYLTPPISAKKLGGFV